jgi:hypothetical protein
MNVDEPPSDEIVSLGARLWTNFDRRLLYRVVSVFGRLLPIWEELGQERCEDLVSVHWGGEG